MKYSILPLLISLSIFVFRPLHASTNTYDFIEILPSLGPLLIGQSNDWIDADTRIAGGNPEKKSIEEVDILTGFLNYLDYSPQSLAPMLSWKHARYFVNVYPEENTVFGVLYQDVYGNDPAPGYPRVTYWQEGTLNYITLSMELIETQAAGSVYGTRDSLAPGKYWYRYSVINTQFSEEYSLETSSFVVTRRPQDFENKGVAEQATITNSRIHLRWDAADPSGQGLSYRLYFGPAPGNLALIYEGENPYYEILSLEYGKQYYWQVESINTYGVSLQSPLYQFFTLFPISKAFNYPNPFNPALSQNTRIVFDMANSGSAEITIYSEMGDICWQKSFNDLPKGANEVSYDGKDETGKNLYNGTYVCLIEKKYPDREDKDKCRILIIK